MYHVNACKSCLSILQISDYEVTPMYDIMVFATKVTKIVNITSYYTGPPKTPIEVIQDLDNFDYWGK